ncbi:hypothetical protein [Staphylococcus aureus]
MLYGLFTFTQLYGLYRIFHLESHYLLVDDLRMNSISSLSNYFIKFF